MLYSGEVQTTGGMFRKKSQYLVLTDTHLVRFKSQQRASEVFPSIPSSIGRSSGIRHSRMSSSGSLHELHTSSATESQAAIPLSHIVAVYKLDDGRPYFSVEIAYLDEETMHASAMTLQLHDPTHSELWLSSVRGAALKARLTNPTPFSQTLVEYTARALEQERDYDPKQFHMFKVVQRATKSGARSSSDDLTKLTTNVCVLAIGVYKIHLVPLPKYSRTASNTSLSDMSGTSHGVANLTSFSVQNFDDTFTLTFRMPLRQQSKLCLASSCVQDVALWSRQAVDYLRPEWLEHPFTWNVPQSWDDEVLGVPSSDEDHQCFDRTLTAYCASYDIDTSKIRYTVDYQCEDAPTFVLLPPGDGRRTRYSALELLAVMRALRYNESFSCISFANVSLDVLHNLRDPNGNDHVPSTTRSGEPLNIPDQANFTLLVQEIQAIALKSKRLRRMDFSHSLTRKFSTDGKTQDPGCGICEALFPLCARQKTNVDWVILNGIVLTDVDIDYLFAAAIDKSCHFRAIEMGYCGLVDRSMNTVIHAMSHQGTTMEAINISGNLARLDPSAIDDQFRSFGFIRKLDLSNNSRLSGPAALLSSELLVSWKLEEICLNRCPLNAETIDALAVYLHHPQSDALRLLQLDQCGLSGSDAATLIDSMGYNTGVCREMHIQLSDNRLEPGHDLLMDAVSCGCSPSQVTMQMLEYTDEKKFQGLIKSFARNSTTKYLDISRISLPSDASEETCEELRKMFAENATLEYLDISGEQTHLEAANFGDGLNHALIGLKHNTSLKILRIEHQKLGLQGASTLASVLEENRALQEIHCEDNELNLQAFTILVNSMEYNTTLLYLPFMETDRAWTQKKVDREVESLRDNSNSTSLSTTAIASTKATMRRTLGKSIASQKPVRPEKTGLLPEYDFKAAMGSLSSNWDREVARLQQYLRRNYNLAHGIPLEGPRLVDPGKPGSSHSLATAMRGVNLDKTTSAEMEQLEGDGNEKEMNSAIEDLGDEDDEGDGALEMSQNLHV